MSIRNLPNLRQRAARLEAQNAALTATIERQIAEMLAAGVTVEEINALMVEVWNEFHPGEPMP